MRNILNPARVVSGGNCLGWYKRPAGAGVPAGSRTRSRPFTTTCEQ